MNLFKQHRQALSRFARKPGKTKVRREIPEEAFVACPSCHELLLPDALRQSLQVCPLCGHHLRLGAAERIRQLCDPGSFRELDGRLQTENYFDFDGYEPKLTRARQASGLKESVVCGLCRMDGIPAALGVMDSHFMMGSMGAVTGEKITRLTETARRRKLPLILFCTSGGARMQEGIRSLVQMAKTSQALEQFSRDGGLCITVLTDPTTGGVSASFAFLGDIILAEPGALIGFAGQRVIEKTIGEKLPEGFQRAEFCLEKGQIDAIVPRSALKKTLVQLMELHGLKGAV